MNRIWSKICVLLVTAVLVLTGGISAAAEEEQPQAGARSYEIAVVYDNSGSMYENESWCRAKYAMEIFAAMLSDGDTLRVYPMWPVSTDGSGSGSGSSAPITVTSKADIEQIHNMYTPMASGTPFETVETAYGELIASDADEKWLIVISDGNFNNFTTFDEVLAALKGYSDDAIHLQYLGIGEFAPDFTAETGGNFYGDKALSSADVTSCLSNICNRIFQRDVLTPDHINGDQVSFDVSMKKLIVFAQGDGASIGSLTAEDGTAVPEVAGSRYLAVSSGLGAGNYPNAPRDDTLKGEVVTFDACKAGTYTLEYTGDVEIFYELDVDIVVSLTDAEGNVISTDQEEIPSGNYTVTYGIVDSQTGQDVTGSPLFGGDVQYDAYLQTASGGEDKTPIQSGDSITLGSDESTYISVTATYLGGKYKVTTDDEQNTYTFRVIDPMKAMSLTLEEPDSYYTYSEIGKEQVIRAELQLSGKPVSDETLREMEIDVSCTGGIICETELCPGESAFFIKFRSEEPQKGDCVLTAKASYYDSEGRQIRAEDTAEFEIGRFARWMIVLFWVLVVLFLLFLLWLWMNQKVFPKKIFCQASTFTVDGMTVPGNPKVEFSKKGKIRTLDIQSPRLQQNPSAKCGVKLTAKAIDPRRKKSRMRRLHIIGLTPLSLASTTGIRVGAASFTPDPETKKIRKNGSRSDVIDFQISNGVKVLISARCMDMAQGRDTDVTLTVTLKFQ